MGGGTGFIFELNKEFSHSRDVDFGRIGGLTRIDQFGDAFPVIICVDFWFQGFQQNLFLAPVGILWRKQADTNSVLVNSVLVSYKVDDSRRDYVE